MAKTFALQHFLSIASVASSILLYSCATDSADQASALNAQNQKTESEKPSIGLPVDFPAPPDTSANLGDTNVLGDGNHWFGHLSLTTPATIQDTYWFYASKMPASGWEQISSSISESVVQIFINRVEGRACVITITARTAFKGSHIDVLISPLDGSFARPK